MQPLDHATNPFALMTDPQAVLQAVQLSDRLAGLQSRVYRPLDHSQDNGRSNAPADGKRNDILTGELIE